MTRTLLIPAAGRGTRLGSPLPKVLTPVCGRPMLEWILDRHRAYCSRIVLVVHPADRAAIEAGVRRLDDAIACAEQPAPTGMLDAILAGRALALDPVPDRIWITWCDQVLISAATAAHLAAVESGVPGAAAVFPTSRQRPPYIHFDRDADGTLRGVRQRREGDPMPEIGESDAGLFSLSRDALAIELPSFATMAARGRGTAERNFLPFLPWLAARAPVVTFDVPAIESLGVNTPEDLAQVERRLIGLGAGRP